jgi:hypothetical protein
MSEKIRNTIDWRGGRFRQLSLKRRSRYLLRGPIPDSDRRQLGVYSVEKLLGRILLENARALESLEFERAEGPAIFDDISS